MDMLLYKQFTKINKSNVDKLPKRFRKAVKFILNDNLFCWHYESYVKVWLKIG